MRTSIMWKSNRKNRKTLSSNQIVQIPSSLLSIPSQSKSTFPSTPLQTTTTSSSPSYLSCLVRCSYPSFIQPSITTNTHLSDNTNQQKTAKDVAGRENKGMGMADKLAGAVKDPINQTLGGNNQKSKGEAAEQNDTKGENIPGSSIPGKNY